MKTIHKFPLDIGDKQAILYPKWGKILSVQFQGTQLCMWVMLDPEEESTFHTIEIFGTGHEIPETSDAGRQQIKERRGYAGTVQISGLVWHVFERYEDNY